MLKRVCLLLVAVFFGFQVSVFAQNTPKVAIAPFAIHTDGDPDYFKTEIVGILSDLLKKNGADVVPVAAFSDQGVEPAEEAEQRYRDVGRQAGVDFVVWGSVTWIGGQYSIDTRLLDVLKGGAPATFFVQGEGSENLLSVVQSLARDIAGRILVQVRIADVVIAGNKRIEDDAIKKKILAKRGDPYVPENLTEDLKRVYNMGYFDDIRIEAEDSPDGKVVIFQVTEKPTIREVRIEGEDEIDEEDIRGNIDIRTGSIFNIFKIKREVNKIETLYKEKNYHNVRVTYAIEPLEDGRADLEFNIEEGDKSLIQKITFEGNKAFTDDELRDLMPEGEGIWAWPPFSWFETSSELGSMETEEEGFFSFITDSGELDIDTLNQDVAKLNAFYQNHGYIQARVADPEIDYKGEDIFIKIKIEEGQQYRVDKIDVEGDLVRAKEEMLHHLQTKSGEVFNRGALRKDLLLLTDVYQNLGYFYADIYPRIDRKPESLTVDVTFVAKKGNLVYFEKIIIAGNTTTRDKVIRRELPIVEQALYSGERLKRGVRNLNRLDYFEDVKVNTLKGSSDDKMVLKIEVTEKPTGAFSFGAGYSSLEDFFVTASITERNLFGRGQTLKLNGEVGGKTTQFNLSFTEPWLFDIPLSATVNVYNVSRDYDSYTRDTVGGGVGLGYLIFDYTRLSGSYVYEESDYQDIDEEASEYVKQLEGQNTTSKVIGKLSYDSRDKAINASEGSDHSLTAIYAGGPLRGDIGFSKYLAETGWYFPLFWGTVGFLHGETGYVRQNGDQLLPEEERFFLGGINTLRGFEWKDVSPEDPETGYKYGGNKFVQFNVEFIYPLFKKAGLNGVLFYDTGNAFDNGEGIDFGNLRKSAGFGFRWQSPIGPIRIERGYILDPKEDENGGGRWEFTMGSAF